MKRVSRFSHSHRVVVGVVLLLLLFYTGMEAKRKVSRNTPSEVRLKWYQNHVDMKEQSMFKNLKWQFLGPLNVSGRMTDVAVVAPKGKHYTIYVAGASGGVWKTNNEGVTWEPVFENAAATAIGDIALAPSDQNIVWVGTGEANIFRSSQCGAGIYKSTDAGKTWKHMGLAGTLTIARIVVHPTNPDVVYVAASGHEWTYNKERGVYKTVNGGKTWQKVLYINEKTAAIDLMIDPQDTNVLYAATWQRVRKNWNDPRNEPDYTGSGIHKTTDGGKTWKAINTGLPAAKYRGRIGIDLCLAKPNVLYAFIDNYEIQGKWQEGETDSYGRPRGGQIKGATVYRSDDRGETWKQASQNSNYMLRLSATYGWVFGQMRVDPNNENRIYVMGLMLNVSDDAGKTFRRLPGMHVDHHGLWIDPQNSNYLVNVNDGGVAISYDGGKKWRTFYDNLPLVQFFNVMYDMDKPFRVYGSIQDHGSYRGVVDLSRGRETIPAVEWEGAPGGEGSSHAIDPTNANIVYSAGFYGSISRTDLSTGKRKNLVPRPAKGEPRYRGQWVAPFIISPHNPRVIYHGMNYLFRSMNMGESWQRISPDLTYNRKDMMGDIPFQTIFAISESPLKFGLIYAGTDDGRIHVTKNGGTTWQEITRGLPYRKWISRVVASAFNQGTVYVSQNGKRDDDFKPYLWKSTNYGKTWQNMAANIPLGPINVVREDPKNRDILYAGTDLAVYVTVDGGKSWQVLGGNLPTTYVHDLVVHPRDDVLVIATHGRGMFALDVSHLQKISAKIMQEALYLFKVHRAKLPQRSWRGMRGGKNAYFHCYLKEATTVKVVIKNAKKQTIREWSSKGNPGFNTIVWDLTLKQEAKPVSGRAGRRFVKPGSYTVQLQVAENMVEKSFEVKK